MLLATSEYVAETTLIAGHPMLLCLLQEPAKRTQEPGREALSSSYALRPLLTYLNLTPADKGERLILIIRTRLHFHRAGNEECIWSRGRIVW